MPSCHHSRCSGYAILLLVFIFFLPALSFHLPERTGHITCFVYHRFEDDRYPSTNISALVFRGQLAFLKQNNFTVWTMGKAVDAFKNGDIIPPRTVVLTIDDGYRSFYETGLPLLQEFGYPATLYVNTANVGNRDYFTWQDIREAQQKGIEIGCHSHAHGHFLDAASQEEMKSMFISDLATAQTIFSDSLGFIPDLYSYPYGEYDDLLGAMLKEAGFKSATAQYSGVLYEGTGLFEVPRFPMGGPFATLKGFIQKSQMNPIRVIEKHPKQIVMSQNPPVMEITMYSDCINAEYLQCFVNGERNCITETQEGPDFVKLKIVSRDLLPGRRSLYTITAPAKDGRGWCWYSHVWVNTDIPEE